MAINVTPDGVPITRTTGRKKKVQKPDPISTYRGKPVGAPKTSVPKSVSSSNDKKKSSKTESDPYEKERKRAQKRERELDKKARDEQNRQARVTAQNDLLQSNNQILAKRAQREVNKDSLSSLRKMVNGLSKVRQSGLDAVSQSLQTKMAQIDTTYNTSLESFRENQRDNDASEGDSSFANLTNRAREASELSSMTSEHGAGETDTLRAQLQALRNWSANQGDVTRSFFDTESSINSGITDLNNTTKTSKLNEEMSANATRASVWDDYYSSLSDTYTQMSNLDQQNYLLTGEIVSTKDSQKQSRDLLGWIDKGKDYEDYKAPKVNTKLQPASKTSFKSPWADKAAETATAAWRDPGVSQATKNWQGAALRRKRDTGGGVGRVYIPKAKKAEGSTLKEW